MKRKVLIGVFIVLGTLGAGVMGGCSTGNNEVVKEEQQEQKEKNPEEVKKEDIELSDGNYIAGEDFDAGVYDIVAVKGGGNVISSNAYNGGVNTILGTEEKSREAEEMGINDFYKPEYKNVRLSKGTKLSIDGVTVKLVYKKSK